MATKSRMATETDVLLWSPNHCDLLGRARPKPGEEAAVRVIEERTAEGHVRIVIVTRNRT
jgi:hypothetical protein